MKFAKGTQIVSNLEALVVQDLKEIGVKVPKLKKSHDHDTTADTQNLESSCTVFGNSLSCLPCIAVEGCGLVPKFLVEIVNLMNKDMDVEGIFRKSGSLARLKDIKTRVEAGESVDDANVLDLAGLMKQFFRDLPEPLLTNRLQTSFMSCHELMPPSRGAAAILLLCHLLPDVHLATLRFISLFLNRVAQQSFSNKMDASNIAICLAPNIFHNLPSVGGGNSELARSALSAQTTVVQLFIERAVDIGVLSDDLQERLALMTECFSDSTVDDCGLEVTENRDKKRSGSLQGLVSNLSNSFTKWRNKDKHNTSITSSSSTTAVGATSATIPLSTGSTQPDTMYVGLTPVVIRKRKAEDEMLAFSAGRKKAILQNMPQMSVLGTTPFAPSSIKKGKYCDMEPVMSTPTPLAPISLHLDMENDKHSAVGSTGKMKRGNSLDSSPSYNSHSKNKVRKSFEGLIRRLSGGKDCQSRDKADTSSLRQNDTSVILPQRSPSAPSFFLTPLRDSQNLGGAAHLHCSFECQSVTLDDCCYGNEGRRRQRSLSADGGIVNTSLRRGRPNTVRAGLPSPVHRRPSDAGVTMASSEDHAPTSTVIDTSPIVGNDDLEMESEAGPEESYDGVSDEEDGDDDDRSDAALSRQTSQQSVGVTSLEDDTLDRAFVVEGDLAVPDDLTSVAELSPAHLCQPAKTTSVPRYFREDSSSHSSLMMVRRNPLERFVSVTTMPRSPLLTDGAMVVGSTGASVPRIKPSLMPDMSGKRLQVKTSSPCMSRRTPARDSPASMSRALPNGTYRRLEPL